MFESEREVIAILRDVIRQAPVRPCKRGIVREVPNPIRRAPRANLHPSGRAFLTEKLPRHHIGRNKGILLRESAEDADLRIGMSEPELPYLGRRWHERLQEARSAMAVV